MATMWPVVAGKSFTLTPMQIERSVDRLILVQGPSTLLKVAVWGFVFAVALGVFALYATLFTVQTTRLVCDRASGKWEREGLAPRPLAEISGAELTSYHRNKQGDFYVVTLLLNDGTKLDVTPYGAQETRSVAEYRAMVESVRTFLADPSQPRLDVSCTKRSSLSEKVYAVGTFALGVFACALLMLGWRAQSFTFDGGARQVLLSCKRFVGSGSTRQIPFDQIVAIGDRQIQSGRRLELRLADGSTEAIVDGSIPAALVDDLSQILKKPLQR
jgi:hypothetical protein